MTLKYAQMIPGNRFTFQFKNIIFDARGRIRTHTHSPNTSSPLSYKSTTRALSWGQPTTPPISYHDRCPSLPRRSRATSSRHIPARPVQPTPSLGRVMAAVEHGVGKRTSIKDTRSDGTPR
jgi:hypothetical protein